MKRLSMCIFFSLLFFILAATLIGATDQKTGIDWVESRVQTVYLGSGAELPDIIRVRYQNGKSSYLPVKWDLQSINTSKAGIVVCKGTVDGYHGRALLICNVIPYINQSREPIEFSIGQLKALNNCLEYIKNNSRGKTKPINKQIVRITTASFNLVKEYYKIEGGRYKTMPLNPSDWIISIGSTRRHNYYALVCNSNTYEVLGVFPID